MKTTKLEKLNACKDAVKWVKTQKSILQAWLNCERGDWMLWLAEKLNVDDKKLTLTKVKIVEPVRHLLKDQRSKDALQACFNYANGKITRKRLNVYAADAYAAYAAAAADVDDKKLTMAADAAYAYAAYAAANALLRAANFAADAADAYVRVNSLKKSADICREYLTDEVILKYKNLKV